MNEPSRTIIAAAAMAALLTEITDVPELAALHGRDVFWGVHGGELNASFYAVLDGPAILAAAEQYFGGEFRTGRSRVGDTVERTLVTNWGGVSLEISAPVPQADEVAALRRKIAELETAAAAGAQASV